MHAALMPFAKNDMQVLPVLTFNSSHKLEPEPEPEPIIEIKPEPVGLGQRLSALTRVKSVYHRGYHTDDTNDL